MSHDNAIASCAFGVIQSDISLPVQFLEINLSIAN